MNSSPPVLADLVDLADVWMIHARGRARFAPESLARRLVAGQRRHRLQGDRALETLVARRVHDPHSALPQLARHRVVADAIGQVVPRGVARDARRRTEDGSGDGGAPVSHS